MKKIKIKNKESKYLGYSVERIADSKTCLYAKRYPLNAKTFFDLIFVFCILNVSGCATYKYQLGKAPYDKGYMVSRDGYVIPEYTIGKDNSAPNNIDLAKDRFRRRKGIVEHYYKKMGNIDNRFKMAFWEPCVMSLKAIAGFFRLPSIAISDYKYEHNTKYRERIKKKEQEEDAKEEMRIQKLKDGLNSYIQKDLTKENP